MKKILVCVMVLALCLCATISSFAAGQSEADFTGKTGNQDVNVTISGAIVHTYLVDIEFTNTTFTYSTGSVWDPENYVYKPNNATATWNGKGEVKIINHSDLPVNYTVESKEVVKTFGDLSIPVTNGNGTIEKCNAGDARGSHNATAIYVVEGTPTVSEITAQKLGSILVTITK
jgi:hypothetical protein